MELSDKELVERIKRIRRDAICDHLITGKMLNKLKGPIENDYIKVAITEHTYTHWEEFLPDEYYDLLDLAKGRNLNV